ncbi:MAG: hypothetical protein KDE19_18155, partial [Caldilineaceae bacterium]|nr:hypothetical protein [Caldilineaceae bacterium]
MSKRIGQIGLLLFVVLAGGALRALRLNWQPLWADEGYSIYFATEPPARMIGLTAHDIHPPLYYLLLHLWQLPTAGPTPIALRLFSLAAAIPALLLLVALAHQLFPGRRRLLWVATLLFAVNPAHLFYSQEVRMYGLALTLSLASTLAFCLMFVHVGAARRTVSPRVWLLLYIFTTTAALYTLYYTAFLFLAHLLWLLRQTKGKWLQLRLLLLAQSVIGLLYLPWVLYVAGDLTSYVDDKIGADQDLPLGLGTYLLRHLLAFFAGHLTLPTWPVGWRLVVFFALALLFFALLGPWYRKRRTNRGQNPTLALPEIGEGIVRFLLSANGQVGAIGSLWSVLLIPSAIA